MNIKDLAQGKLILWGANWSLYTAKPRSYLIKKGLDYIELNPSHPHYNEVIVPQIGHFTVPVLEFPDGEIIADSTDILYRLEKDYPENSMTPGNKTLAALAWFIQYFASEGMPPSALHYRWNKTEESRQFTIDEFNRSVMTKDQREAATQAEKAQFASDIAEHYLPDLGLIEGQSDLIERQTEELYDILQRHFTDYPYILGGRPSMADFGLITPFYPHLGRDLPSSNVVKLKYPALFRWIETMNRAPVVDPETYDVAPEYFDLDKLPHTVIELLQLITKTYGPELIAVAGAYHQWLHQVPNRPAGSIIATSGEKSNHQTLGPIEFELYGRPYKRTAILDCLIAHQELGEMIAGLNQVELNDYKAIMDKVDGQSMLELKLERPIVTDDYCATLG